MVRIVRAGIVALIAASWGGCNSDGSSADGGSAPQNSGFQISGLNVQVNSPGFFFLPPLRPRQTFSGTFAHGLSPVVQIDRIQGPNGPFVRTVAVFTTNTGVGHERVREVHEHYMVEWKTHKFNVCPGQYYRIHVLLSGQEQGFADVEIVGHHHHGRHAGNPDVLALEEGHPLHIRFRIEEAPSGGGGGGPTGTVTMLSSGSADEQQNDPVISGTQVVWTNAGTSGGSTNFDQFGFDLNTGLAQNLTNTPLDQEFLSDIDGTKVVWTHTSTVIPGDIVVYDLSTNLASTIASSTTSVHFEQPAIKGRYVTFLRVSSQIDVYLYDILTGTPLGLITNDAAVQNRPRVGADVVVYEDYSAGNSDILAYRISTQTTFSVATGPGNQITPDIDGNTIVYVDDSSGSDQICSYDLVTGVVTQLTTVVSSKVLPRISGTRVVWTDDRNGNLDLYCYDFLTHQEAALVTGTGDQFLADIDGDRVVYTDNSAGFEQVFLFTFDP